MAVVNLSLRKSANHPSDDSSTAGGAATVTAIDDDPAGQWLPPLATQESGTLDVDTEVQYQLAYLFLTTAHEVDELVVSLSNGIALFSAAAVSLSSSSAADNSNFFVRLWGKSGGILRFEDLVLNGTSTVAGSLVWQELYRAEMRLLSSMAQVAAAGLITLTDGLSPVGYIPQGKRTATRELALAAPAATGHLSTFANRRTEPGGGALTWNVPVLATASTISLPGPIDDSGAGGNRPVGIYCKQTAQPGLPTAALDLVPWFDGKVTRG